MLKKLWSDEQGTVAFEYLLVGTLVALSLVVGLSTVGKALNSELIELSSAITTLNQEYSYNTLSGCGTYVGSGFTTDAQFVYGAAVTTPEGGNINISGCTGAATP